MKKLPALILLTTLIVSTCQATPVVTPTIEATHAPTTEPTTTAPTPTATSVVLLRMEKSAQQFTASETFQAGLGDLDSDGDLDALVTNGFRATGSFPSRLFLNDGAGRFTEGGQTLNPTMGSELAVGDLDLDGDLDVFASNISLPDEVWLNDGTGHFADSGLRLEGDNSTKPSLGDLDGDGDLEVIVGSLASSRSSGST